MRLKAPGLLKAWKQFSIINPIWRSFSTAWKEEGRLRIEHPGAFLRFRPELVESSLAEPVGKHFFKVYAKDDITNPRVFSRGSSRWTAELSFVVPHYLFHSSAVTTDEQWTRVWNRIGRGYLSSLTSEFNAIHLFTLGSIHTADHFVSRHSENPWTISSQCSLCGNAAETKSHLFGDCELASQSWNLLPLPAVEKPSYQSLRLPHILKEESMERLAIMGTWVDHLWRLRNSRRYSEFSPGEPSP